MLTLTQIAAAIVTGATAVESVITTATIALTDLKRIVVYIPELMQTFEDAYAFAGQPDNGAGKLAGVLAALEAVAAKIGVIWSTAVKSLIADIIAQAKAAYNAVVAAVTKPAVVATTRSAAVLPNAAAA